MTYFWAIAIFAALLTGLTLALILAERYFINYGTCKIDINSGERVLEVEGGQTLLSALIAAEIFIPSACGGRGSCGFCKVTVLKGGGSVLPTETPFLSRRELREGVRMACQIKIREDMQIKIPEEMLSVKRFSAKLEYSKPLTNDIKEISFILDEGQEIEQRPGQYIQVQVPSPEGPVFRAYSISSPSYEKKRIELVVRLVPGGLGSTYLHNLKPGDTVSLTGPYGEFRLNEDPAVEIVCVGGGCGMAPMKNIIYSLYDRWPTRSCRLFFGCRTQADVFYYEEFKKLSEKHPNFRVVYALSEAESVNKNWDGETGFIHLAVDKHLEPAVKHQAFLCGPPPMIEAVTSVLTEKGLKPEDIFYDKF